MFTGAPPLLCCFPPDLLTQFPEPMNTDVGRTGDPSHTRCLDWFILALHFPLYITHFPKDQYGDHLWRGQAVLVVVLRIWIEGKGAKWFQTRAKSNKPSLPTPTPTADSFSNHSLFAKWKPTARRSLSITLKRLDDQWHRRHSIFLLNWDNQLICFGCSGILRWWQKPLKGHPVGRKNICLFTSFKRCFLLFASSDQIHQQNRLKQQFTERLFSTWCYIKSQYKLKLWCFK